jgi:hypothetical protein
MDPYENPNNLSASFEGPVSGQVIIGSHNNQVQDQNPVSRPVSEAERSGLRQEFSKVKDLIETQCLEPGAKQAALERLNELEIAVLEGTPQVKTLSKMEYVRDWFIEQLPGIAGAVSGLVVHPIVGRLVEAGGDALAAEFKRRFGT